MNPPGTELDLAVLAARPGDLFIADLADDIDDQDVAALGRPLDRLRFALLLGDALKRRLDALLRHLDDEPLEVEIGEIRSRDLGQDLDQHLVFEVGALAAETISTFGGNAGRRLCSRIASAELPCTVLSSTSPRTAGP